MIKKNAKRIGLQMLWNLKSDIDLHLDLTQVNATHLSGTKKSL